MADKLQTWANKIWTFLLSDIPVHNFQKALAEFEFRDPSCCPWEKVLAGQAALAKPADAIRSFADF
jgi:hypothetical protein